MCVTIDRVRGSKQSSHKGELSITDTCTTETQTTIIESTAVERAKQRDCLTLSGIDRANQKQPETILCRMCPFDYHAISRYTYSGYVVTLFCATYSYCRQNATTYE